MVDELRDALAVLSERGTPVGAEEVLEGARERLQPERPPSSMSSFGPWPRGVLVAAASAVLVMAAIGVVWLVQAPHRDGDPQPQPPATPVVEEPAVSVPFVEEPTDEVPVIEEPIEAPQVDEQPPPTEPAPTEEPVAGLELAQSTPVSWTKLDDVTGALSGPGDQFLQAVTVGGPGLIAVGAVCDGYCPYWPEEAHWSAAVWTSSDGTAWQRVPHDEAIFGGAGDQMMLDVVAGGPGYVAVGFSHLESVAGYVGDGTLDAAVWVSPDGLSWEIVSDPDGVFTGPLDERMDAVTAGGPGLVAAGTIGNEAAIWTSPNGLDWTRIVDEDFVPATPPDGVEGTEFIQIHDVVAKGSRLVAVGVDWSGYYGDDFQVQPNLKDPIEQLVWPRAAVWVSSDAVSWDRVGIGDPVFGGGPETHPDAYTIDGGALYLWAVAGYEDGFIAGGWGQFDRAIWTSPDGEVWTRIPDDAPGWDGRQHHNPVRSFVIEGDRVAPVGWDPDSVRVVWPQTTRRFVPSEPRLGIQSGPAIEMADVVVFGDKLIAVGTQAVGSSAEGDEETDAAVWIGEWEG